MSASLYTNYDGRDVKRHSYSAGSEFRRCPRAYKFKRKDGWRSKKERAALEFGKALESSIQVYHEAGCRPTAGACEFRRIWETYKDRKDLIYTDKEGDWNDLFQMGEEMLRLYHVKLPSFGFDNPRFQLNYRKEVFPGSELAGLEDQAWVDMVAEFGKAAPFPNGRQKVLIDIKTTGSSFDGPPGMIALDPQLREYAWLTGIRTVAFMFFVKMRPSSFKRGDTATLLESDYERFPAGNETIVIDADVDDETYLTVLEPKDYAQFKRGADGVRGKKLDELIAEARQDGYTVKREWVTKQRLQFITATIDEPELREIGEVIGQQMADIVRANQIGVWPKTPGVRFPDDHCKMCDFLDLCLKRKEPKTLVQIKRNQEERLQITNDDTADWIDEL